MSLGLAGLGELVKSPLGPLSPSMQSPTTFFGVGGGNQQQLQQQQQAEDQEPKVLVGKLIGADHENYVLMYNMLTGIRIGVSVLRRIELAR